MSGGVHALPPGAAQRARRRIRHALLALALGSVLVAGCGRKSVVVADLELTDDGGPDVPAAGSGAEPETDGGAGDGDDAGAGGGMAGSWAGDAGSRGERPPRCELSQWFWPALAISLRDCKVRVSDEWLLRWLAQIQAEVPIDRSGESRQSEPCDYIGWIAYLNPKDRQEVIVCPSVCTLIKASVFFASEDHLQCLASASQRR